MYLCDYCGKGYHRKCMSVRIEYTKRFWYCDKCSNEIKLMTNPEITLDLEVLDYLYEGQIPEHIT